MTAGRDDDMPNAESVFDALGKFDAEGGDVVDSNLDNPGGNGGLQQTGDRWARNVHLLGDLFLRATFQIIKLGDLDQKVAFFVQRLRHTITPLTNDLNIKHPIGIVKQYGIKCVRNKQ